jgi:hypothetical protein
MVRKYVLKIAMLALALSGVSASTGIQAQPSVAEGPYVVNFLNSPTRRPRWSGGVFPRLFTGMMCRLPHRAVPRASR